MLTVKENKSPNRKGTDRWQVVTESGEVVAAFGLKAIAWQEAVYRPFRANGTWPVVGPGGMFKAKGSGRQAGWTSDPRQAAEVRPTDALTVDQIAASKAAMARFIAACLGTFDPFAPETPAESPESDSESLSGTPEGECPTNPVEAAREALSDSDRQAFDNFRHLGDNAVSEAASRFWHAKADALISQSNWKLA